MPLEQPQALLGLAVFCLLAWLASEDRSRFAWRLAVIGIGVQFVIAAVLLKVPFVRDAFGLVNVGVAAIQRSTGVGAEFVFGYLAGGPGPFVATRPEHGFVLAFQALPLILVVSALTALLTYWRVLPAIVNLFSRALERVFGLGGAVGLGAAANVFLGMVEAPLFVRPYLAAMSRSELFVLMSTGMATVAGNVLVLFASLLAGTIDDAAGHLLVASLISVPAAIVFAHIMVPPVPGESSGDRALVETSADSAMSALADGTQQGLQLCLNVAAMLLVLVALVHLINQVLGAALPDLGGQALSLERLLGFVMAPLAWLSGIPWAEAATAGQLLGVKTILNELLAYVELGQLAPDALSERSRLILLYALSGFANIGSLGIIVTGLSTMAPTRRSEVVALGPRCILAGTLATLCTGTVIGLMY